MTEAEKQAAKIGRPTLGRGKDGEPERIRDYPRLSLTVSPKTKQNLDIVAKAQARPAWQIVEEALTQYFGQLPRQLAAQLVKDPRATGSSSRKTKH